MNDDELREMVRESIARHLGGPAEAFPLRFGENGRSATALAERLDASHASHAQLRLLRGGDGDGACLIEPSVRCTHCGYCLSYGH